MATEKRLTEKHYNGKGYYMKCSGLCSFDGHCADCDELVKIVDRLGEYEDKAKQTVDAVEVVRCKDCKWRNTRGCPYMNFNAVARNDLDFCSDGERSEHGL